MKNVTPIEVDKTDVVWHTEYMDEYDDYIIDNDYLDCWDEFDDSDYGWQHEDPIDDESF